MLLYDQEVLHDESVARIRLGSDRFRGKREPDFSGSLGGVIVNKALSDCKALWIFQIHEGRRKQNAISIFPSESTQFKSVIRIGVDGMAFFASVPDAVEVL